MNSKNKNYTISIRVNQDFIDKLYAIYKDYLIGATYVDFSLESDVNKSFIIEKAVNVLYKLDLSHKETFMEVFGLILGDKYLSCCNTKQDFTLESRKNM